MKANISFDHGLQDRIVTPFIIKKKEAEVELVGYQHMKHHHVLQLGIQNVTRENYRLFLKGHYLTIILSEVKEFKKPIHVRNMSWDIYTNKQYEIMHNIDIWLPGDNFFLIKHYIVPGKQVLNIVLGHMNMSSVPARKYLSAKTD